MNDCSGQYLTQQMINFNYLYSTIDRNKHYIIDIFNSVHLYIMHTQIFLNLHFLAVGIFTIKNFIQHYVNYTAVEFTF